MRAGYFVYDLDNSQVSIGQAKYSDESNVVHRLMVFCSTPSVDGVAFLRTRVAELQAKLKSCGCQY